MSLYLRNHSLIKTTRYSRFKTIPSLQQTSIHTTSSLLPHSYPDTNSYAVTRVRVLIATNICKMRKGYSSSLAYFLLVLLLLDYNSANRRFYLSVEKLE